MAKEQTITLNIGDWERDCNCLKQNSEFALLKLVFKMVETPERGVFIANFRTLCVLFKATLDETKEILEDLSMNNILNIEQIEEGKFKIISRRMVREATLSKIRSEAGEQGGRGNKANKKQIKSKTLTKSEQNSKVALEKNEVYILDVEYIVKLLNKESNKNFDFKNKKTISLISARFKEGYFREDFEKVIKDRSARWLNDDKMSEYLRPETLFSKKFEGYLNSVPKSKSFTQTNTIPEHEYAMPSA